ncbi:uncharacterized protein [Panulirus ornatus]|uniref:uncharacterized protein isoform X3 n=1 Tax=Panulirus ornatus TaxID=150431 RepID=UPI003A879DEA
MDLASINVTDLELTTFRMEGAARIDDSSWTEGVTGLELLTYDYITYWILGAPRSHYQKIVAWSAIINSVKIISKFQLTSISLDKVNRIAVNGHSLDSITREFLLDGVDQNVQESWRANYMEVDVFTTLGSPITGTISGVLNSGEWPLTRQHNSGVPPRWCRSECTGKLACKLHGSGCLHHPWQSHSRYDLWSAN